MYNLRWTIFLSDHWNPRSLR